MSIQEINLNLYIILLIYYFLLVNGIIEKFFNLWGERSRNDLLSSLIFKYHRRYVMYMSEIVQNYSSYHDLRLCKNLKASLNRNWPFIRIQSIHYGFIILSVSSHDVCSNVNVSKMYTCVYMRGPESKSI